MADGGSAPQLRPLPALELRRPLLDAGSFFFFDLSRGACAQLRALADMTLAAKALAAKGLGGKALAAKALAAKGLAGPLLDDRGGTADCR